MAAPLFIELIFFLHKIFFCFIAYYGELYDLIVVIMQNETGY